MELVAPNFNNEHDLTFPPSRIWEPITTEREGRSNYHVHYFGNNCNEKKKALLVFCTKQGSDEGFFFS